MTLPTRTGKHAIWFVVQLVAILVSGCAGNSRKQSQPADSPGVGSRPVIASRSGDGLVIEHAFGSTVLKTTPQRICTLAFTDETLALGILPAAAAARHGAFPDYLAEQLQGITPVGQMLDVGEPDFECLAACQLDLILTSNVTRQTYDRLSKIAPTIIMSGDGDHNRQRMLDLGLILNKTTEAEDYVKKYARIVALAKTELQAQIGASKVAFFRIWGKQFYIHGHTRGGIMLYDELGLHPPSLIDDHPQGCALTPESLLLLDADILFVAAENNRGAVKSWSTLLEHPVWQHVPAVKRGQVFELSYQQHWLRTGFQARTLMLKEILGALHPASLALKELESWIDSELSAH